MKNKKLLRAQIIAIVFTIIVGTLLHFLYEWTGKNSFVALFSAVNESTWEHLKLAFFPMVMAAIVEYFFIDTKENYIKSKFIGIITTLMFIVVFFYTYTGIIGKNFLIMDILTFIVGVILGEYVVYKNMINNKASSNQAIYVIVIAILTILFGLFTYNPPKINLFKDPVDNSYGINEKKS